MTGLGAAIYIGFFGIAALWLFLTSDYRVRFQTQRPQHAESTDRAGARDESSPWLVGHSSLQ